MRSRLLQPPRSFPISSIVGIQLRSPPTLLCPTYHATPGVCDARMGMRRAGPGMRRTFPGNSHARPDMRRAGPSMCITRRSVRKARPALHRAGHGFYRALLALRRSMPAMLCFRPTTTPEHAIHGRPRVLPPTYVINHSSLGYVADVIQQPHPMFGLAHCGCCSGLNRGFR